MIIQNLDQWLNHCREKNEILCYKTPDQIRPYVESMKDVGEEFNICVIDAFERTNIEENVKKSLFKDGIHFNEKGIIINI